MKLWFKDKYKIKKLDELHRLALSISPDRSIGLSIYDFTRIMTSDNIAEIKMILTKHAKKLTNEDLHNT